MPTYAYQVIREPGEVMTGVMDAENERMASVRLKCMGYHPVRIVERSTERGIGHQFSLGLVRRITGEDVAVFARQLANLIGAGIPLERCLTILQDQTENPRFAKIIEDLKSQIQGGNTFSGALARHPHAFSPLYVSMVHAGEAGGMLEEVLERLADYTEKEQELRGKVHSAMAYPLVLTVVGIATVFVLVSFVIPKFVSMFRDLGQILPLPTRILIRLSGLMSAYWWLVLIVIALAGIILQRHARTDNGTLAVDRLKLRLPVLKGLVQKLEISKFARTLGTLLRNGVPILAALQIVARTLGNAEIARDVVAAHRDVTEGARLQQALGKSRHFSTMVISMIGVGEESGDLAGMLAKVAHTYDQEVDRAVKTMISLVEPAMIIILGGCVGFIVLSILLPIFQVDVLVR